MGARLYPKVRNIKLSTHMNDALRLEAEYRHMTVSDIIRVAVYAALASSFAARGKTLPYGTVEQLPGQLELPVTDEAERMWNRG